MLKCIRALREIIVTQKVVNQHCPGGGGFGAILLIWEHSRASFGHFWVQIVYNTCLKHIWTWIASLKRIEITSGVGVLGMEMAHDLTQQVGPRISAIALGKLLKKHKSMICYDQNQKTTL